MLRWTPSDVAGDWRFAELSTGPNRLEVAGPADGAPVLLVHGLTYPLEVWTFLHRHLAASGRRVVRYDLPGRGLSGFDGRALTLEVLAQQALEVLDAAGIQGRCALVSMSNADLVLARLAVQAPERVSSLVCVAPSGLDPRTLTWAARLTGRSTVLRRLVDAGFRRRAGLRIEGHRAALRPDAEPHARSVYDFALRTVHESPAFAPAALSQLAHAGTPANLLDRVRALARTRVPVTFIDFRADADAQAAGVHAFREHLPQAPWVTLDGDHMGLLQHPRPLNAAVERVLQP